MKESTIVFLHIPKAAGATLRSLFMAVYGRDHTYWIQPGRRRESMRALQEMKPAERARLKVVTGHISYGFVDRFLPQPTEYITMLRDPVDRIRSAYQFIRSHPGHPHYDAVRKQDLLAFVQSDITGLYNMQTRMVSGKTAGRIIGREVFDLARHNLQGFSMVGVQEYYDDFVRALAERLGWHDIPNIKSAHIAKRRIKVDKASSAEILRQNQWDLALHREILARWSDRK